ncbi:hypothetical protein EsH8_IV_000052 [Colletotrichum jinshuiense]
MATQDEAHEQSLFVDGNDGNQGVGNGNGGNGFAGFDNDAVGRNDLTGVHLNCKMEVYRIDGNDYSGGVPRRCNAVVFDPMYARWCYCSTQRKCKPEVNFTGLDGNVSLKTCHACRANSATRAIKDPVEKQKAKAAKTNSRHFIVNMGGMGDVGHQAGPSYS